MAPMEHAYKGGRKRPENAAKTGQVARGWCVICKGPKKAHRRF